MLRYPPSSCYTDQRLALQLLSCPGLSDPSPRQPSKGFQQVRLDAALETTSQPAPSSSLKSPQASVAGALETADSVALLRTPPPSAQKVGWLQDCFDPQY